MALLTGARACSGGPTVVDADGWIVDADCRAVRQGGCHSHMRKPWVSGEISKSWRRVVSLATHWGEGHHHFVLESLVGLVAKDPSLLELPQLAFFKQYLEQMGATIPAPMP